jgi:hypothetical protein
MKGFLTPEPDKICEPVTWSTPAEMLEFSPNL